MNVQTIYIQTIPSEKMAVLVENNKIKQIAFDRNSEQSLVGNIYLGRIVRVDHSLQSAFVQIGLKKLAFLPKKEIPAARENRKKGIENYIHEGQAILVQVIKDSLNEKGPVVTANISLFGHYFVYMPLSNYVSASKNLNEEESTRLKRILANWLNVPEGAIIRTRAKEAKIEDLKKEWLFLQEQWEELKKESTLRKSPNIMWEDENIPNRFLRRFVTSKLDKIIFDDNHVAQRIKHMYPYLADKIVWDDKFTQHLPFSIEHLVDELINREIKLANGMKIFIDKTEACTVFDVNTASFIGKLAKEETIFHTNLEAAKIIAEEIRKRNISGMIIIDFINMKLPQHQNNILHAMKKLLADDPLHCEVLGFTRLGLFEITRKREGLDSFSFFCEPFVYKLSAQSNWYKLERELLEFRWKDTEALLVEMDSDLFRYCKTNLTFKRLKDYIHLPVYMRENASLNRPYVIKFIGDLKWLHENYPTIDKLL
jgi:ribonuclease G